jgi:membrane protease YdiL (CAAX protease family)
MGGHFSGYLVVEVLMTTITKAQPTQFVTSHRRLTFGLILALLVLRYFVTGFRLAFGEPPGWVLPVYEVGTYLLVAILLIRESGSLAHYHINGLALWMIILFKPIETLFYRWALAQPGAPDTFPMAFPSLPSLLAWAIALGLLVYFRSMLFQKQALSWQDLRWALIAILVGFATALVTSYPMSFQVSLPNLPANYPLVTFLLTNSVTLLSIFYQLGYAAVSEEPVFRGFLWGVLRESGWRDIWIWLFQAGLFWLAHLYYLKTSPLSFWLMVPLAGLVLGWLAWRSRSIATSIMAHGVYNTLGPFLDTIVAVVRL